MRLGPVHRVLHGLRAVGVVTIAGAMLAAASPAHASGPAEDDEPTQDADADADASAAASVGTKKKKKKKQKQAEADASSGAGKSSKGAPMKRRFGLGAMRTLTGLNGLVLRGYVTNRLTIGANLGVATFSHRDVDEDGEFGRVRTVGAFGLGPEVLFWPYQGDRTHQVHADFGTGVRVTGYVGFLGRLDEERGETLDIPVEIDIEVPAALQLFIGQRVAILPEFGIAFRIIPGDREPDQNGEFDANPGRNIGSKRGTTDGPGFGFELGDHAGLFMGIGFAYFFGKPAN